MKRSELLKSPEYWKSRIQILLYNCATSFMKKHNKNRKELAQHLGVSNGYVTQLLNGDYDHKLSKLTELSLAFGFIPLIEFVPIEQYIMAEQRIENVKLATSHKHIYKELYKKNTTIKPDEWIFEKELKGAA